MKNLLYQLPLFLAFIYAFMAFTLGFADADAVSPWADEAVQWAVMNRIIIGTGYHKEYYEELAKKYHPFVECIFSPRYAETNSMYT